MVPVEEVIVSINALLMTIATIHDSALWVDLTSLCLDVDVRFGSENDPLSAYGTIVDLWAIEPRESPRCRRYDN